MLKKLQKMQEDLKKVQAEINASTFYGQAGGSVVRVSVKGTKEVISIDIKNEELDMNDTKMVAELIMAALNDAFHKVDKEIEESVGSVSRGINMAGMI
ncbi:MAG: YbaB/EbfC family nucleoid-associated protein [Candidatus Izemoplasmatales bacterium]|nr:YbaB/EbfC family nucleoid-associated protein [Candidatus Izemoplasmatales bacterium]